MYTFMDRKILEYTYPEKLVALEPKEPCRVLLMNRKKTPMEIDLESALSVINEGDLLVVNNSGVKACRVFNDQGLEFLFLNKKSQYEWEVLFKSGRFKIGEEFDLPGGVSAKLIKKGRPQIIELSDDLDQTYFENHGEFAIPPYIQKLRDHRQSVESDKDWYQIDWKKNENSLAAPTASLHFSNDDLEKLKNRGVFVEEVSLDVGLGTFLPLEEKNILEGALHKESFFVSKKTKDKIKEVKKKGHRVWALGTTALRAVESFSDDDSDESSDTELFIMPGYEFKWVDGLFTNFHQPGSSLIALVMAFYGVSETQKAYEFAVKNEFRLFSYGDLSVWIK